MLYLLRCVIDMLDHPIILNESFNEYINSS
ncbi:hypothetical protein PSMA108079_08005 [Pseudoalteromonas mariniglutinosa]